MNVIIGVDPHKATHTAVVIDASEVELACKQVRATRRQVDQLLGWAEPFGSRIWAVESMHSGPAANQLQADAGPAGTGWFC